MRVILSIFCTFNLSFIIVDRQPHAMEKQAWCDKFNDFKGHEQTIEMDEETIDAEIDNLKQIQAVINKRLTQLQTAKDKTAKPWNQGITCTIHANLRKAHVAKSSLEA